jgi:hypothetical protein
MQAAGTINNGNSKLFHSPLLASYFLLHFVNCSSSPMSLATATATIAIGATTCTSHCCHCRRSHHPCRRHILISLLHAYLGQGQGIILLPATCSKNARITVITTIEQSVTMGFPCAFKARCPITAQPPSQITMTQTGSISTSKSIVVGALDKVFFCTSGLCFFC